MELWSLWKPPRRGSPGVMGAPGVAADSGAVGKRRPTSMSRTARSPLIWLPKEMPGIPDVFAKILEWGGGRGGFHNLESLEEIRCKVIYEESFDCLVIIYVHICFFYLICIQISLFSRHY
jgi:hypothetical protein